jgi:nicotinate-nucleotide adenylyltransferase
MSKQQKRIGIFAGTFDPIHSGHINFALLAAEQAGLDTIYFMPERRPRHKKYVEHYGHRVAMARRALKPHPKLEVLETDDISFTVGRTLRRLESQFAGKELVFLAGSDVAPFIAAWQHGEKLLARHELVVGLRGTDRSTLQLGIMPKDLHLIADTTHDVSSGLVREALRTRQSVRGLLASVAQYSNRNWLYVSVG